MDTTVLNVNDDLPQEEFEYNVEEDDVTKYQYTEIDTLDEDKPIPGQLFYIASFASPEGIMNCGVRGLKIRGIYSTMSEAQNRIEELKKFDKYFDMYIGEVGKWNPWNPGATQVESVKYRNKKLDKIMAETQKTRHGKDTVTLNELVGRTKQSIDNSKKAHKKRVGDSIRNTAKVNPTREEPREKEKDKDKGKGKDKDKERSTRGDSSRATDARARLRKLLDEKKNNEAKTTLSRDISRDTTMNMRKVDGEGVDLKTEQEFLKREAEQVYEAEQATRNLAASTEQMKQKLEQVKQLYNKSK